MALTTVRPILRRSSTRGFSLTELAIVLGVVGLVLGGIWVAASSVHENNQTQQAQEQMSLILAGYRSAYALRGIDIAAATDVTCNGVTNSYFPQEMINGGCVTGTTASYPINPWSGYVQVFADPANRGVIQIGYYNLPQQACVVLAQQTGSAPDVVLESVTGNSNGLMPPLGANTPRTLAQLTGGDCGAGNVNSVVLSFRAR